MNKNFFPTLGEALDCVREYVAEQRAVIEDPDSFFNFFAMGGVAYGQTRTHIGHLSSLKGKQITLRMAQRGISLSVYRMESGTYEAVAYIS